uniref:NADH-ubiquinone oxidoreductase chain 6 n=1 Tax=Youtuus strigatus TaxID=2820093 RepID=A0A8A4VL14_9HEMI|nr:NADH dehydrogenase subunit 6 [Youtuus strigatus]QTD82436.1 NADH dehydrogenase subunit 6 [Youtuus strigatus]
MKIMMIMLSLTSPILKHPISLGSTLLIQTIMICNYLSSNFESSWYSYIIFITIIGGMMVMFMYMSSIASNEKFNMIKMKFMFLIIILTIMIMMLETPLTKFISKMEEKKMVFHELEETKSTFKFFNFNKMNITMLMMMILLISMISITNISSSFEGPLKKTYV